MNVCVHHACYILCMNIIETFYFIAYYGVGKTRGVVHILPHYF